MTPAGFGHAALYIAAAVTLFAALPVVLRGLALRRRLRSIAGAPALAAAQACAASAARIGASASEMRAHARHLSAASESLATAAAAAASITAEIAIVAQTTERLLEAFAPSLRGAARDR